jgi:hypothetical protein
LSRLEARPWTQCSFNSSAAAREMTQPAEGRRS